MASQRPLRSLLSASLRPAHSSPRALCRFAPSASSTTTTTTTSTSTSAFSTTPARRNANTEASADALSELDATEERPRWQQTPPRMKAPFRIRPAAKGGVFHSNEDPKRLDDAYVRMLGPNGASVLSDEVKWLAVTHKSFDHGRRGFNDRLAFFGRRIIELQTAQALLESPQAEKWPKNHFGEYIPDKFGRKPFQHPALNGLQGLTDEATHMVLDKSRLAPLAERYGLDKVTRWTPMRADNLHNSGIESVLQTSLYAIVGAIALERGGAAANKVVQDAILAPLGFTFAPEP